MILFAVSEPSLVQLLVACLLSGLLTRFLIAWAPRWGLVDHPNARKVHTTPTPRAGGLAIYATVALLTCLWPDPASVPLLSVGFFIVLLGLIDDLRPLPWQLRLGAHFGCAAAWVLFWPPAPLNGWLQLVVILWIVGLVNAFNMLDNMDALSGGVALIAAAVLFFIPLPAMQSWAGSLLVFIGAVAGFLWFNLPRARIFLGDAGSTFLGFFLAVASLRAGLGDEGPRWAWAAPLCVLAVPLYDMTSVVLIRLRQGRSPFHADKQHLSHRLVERGLSSPAAVGVIHVAALATGLCGLLLYYVSTAVEAALVGGGIPFFWASFAVYEYFSGRTATVAKETPRG